MFTRREFFPACGAAAAAVAAPPPWTPDWDREILNAELAERDHQFDPKEDMLGRRLSSAYSYHSALREQLVHPTRESLDYGLLLLEAGGVQRAERAHRVIERVIGLQDTDTKSKWYGIWGWYMEEPPPKMVPAADFNWADFNGATLLLIEYRHGDKLPAGLRRKVLDSIRHAANSIRRRNVTMSYTNIAVQGTFVTLVAAQLLRDAGLRAYAVDRLSRFEANVDQTASFAEYNSPTYTNVTILNLTRLRMLERESAILARAAKIHHRAWLHLARHWHAPSRQLAGPMSRCYSTDIGKPLWLQKSLGGKLAFATFEEVKSRTLRGGSDTALLDYRCPDDLVPQFLEFHGPRMHREIFLPAREDVRPVAGSTYLAKEYALGSVNRGNFWIQQRALLAYWGGPERPARYAQMRFYKDDYDFTSALLYTAQEKNFVLGLVNFRSPGGDKHPSLDPVKDGQFQCSRFRLRIDIAGAPENAKVLERKGSIAVDLGGARLWFGLRSALLGSHRAELTAVREDSMLVISVDLVRAKQPLLVKWSDIDPAYIAFTLAMGGPEGTLDSFHDATSRLDFTEQAGDGRTRLAWSTPAGKLELTGGIRPSKVEELDALFTDSLNGKPVPLLRLSEERLAG